MNIDEANNVNTVLHFLLHTAQPGSTVPASAAARDAAAELADSAHAALSAGYTGAGVRADWPLGNPPQPPGDRAPLVFFGGSPDSGGVTAINDGFGKVWTDTGETDDTGAPLWQDENGNRLPWLQLTERGPLTEIITGGVA